MLTSEYYWCFSKILGGNTIVKEALTWEFLNFKVDGMLGEPPFQVWAFYCKCPRSDFMATSILRQNTLKFASTCGSYAAWLQWCGISTTFEDLQWFKMLCFDSIARLQWSIDITIFHFRGILSPDGLANLLITWIL